MDLARLLLLAAVCLVSWFVGEGAARFHVPRLPVYLAVGALAGAVWTAAKEGASVAFPTVSTVSLAVIGFVAGSHLMWGAVRPRLKPIVAQVVSMTVVVPLVVGTAIFLLRQEVPTDVRLAGAILAGTVMLALSPPEAIAVIGEAKAAGPFTKLVLGATVVMDVVVVSTFSVALVVSHGLLGDDTGGASLWVSIAAVLGLALLGGVLVGALLRQVVQRTTGSLFVAAAVVVVAGLAAALAPWLTSFAEHRWEADVEIDSLLIAMIAGVIVVNTTRVPERFAAVLEAMAPYVYVVFFTLTGLGLHLDALVAAAGAALLMWVLRLGGLFAASTAAMRLAGEPPTVRRVAWRAYMPQAGIALALASTIAVEFPDAGPTFSTIIIATVVLNEATGPFFLRSALRATGETVTERELLD